MAIAQRTTFNRYPETFGASLAARLANGYGCSARQVMVGPGSSGLIRMLLTYFGLHVRGQLVITRPSFAYYEQFCRAYGIDYKTWELDDDFQYDLNSLDELPQYSVVCLTNPNNPTGNLLRSADLEKLLQQHPTSLFIVDEAYVDFIDYCMLPLLQRYENILLLRTFSKAFSAASIRCGILIGHEPLIAALSALQTPWQLSSFTIEAAKTMLDYCQQTGWIQQQVRTVIHERERMRQECNARAAHLFRVFPSDANFLLLRAQNRCIHAGLLAACEKHRVMVLDLDRQPRLSLCIRVSIGTEAENRLFMTAFDEAVQNLLPELNAANG